jgi:UDP-GlcNAc:undecaprenyl-phosphate GlcNAc-1-phosphate transferase
VPLVPASTAWGQNAELELNAQVLATIYRQPVEFLKELWPVALVSFLVVLVATPVCRTLARKYRIVDRPDDFLKPHKQPIPYMGGVAICAGWAAGILVGVLAGAELGWFPVRQGFLTGILVAGVLIMLVGLWDDLRSLSPKVKLALNIAVGLLLLWVGVGRTSFHIFVQASVAAFEQDPSLKLVELMFSVVLTMVVVVGACNATNLIDGIDGMCSGVLGIISWGFFIVALYLAAYNAEQAPSYERLVLAMAMAGAALGFLPYNTNPASIFMGDAGSMLLGLNAAVLMLLFCEPGFIKFPLCALMVFALPIADMSLAMLRRWRNAQPIMMGDRSHFYDQLVDRGYTVRQVVAISYGLSIGFAAIGCGAAIFLRTRFVILVCTAMFLAIVVAIWKFRMVDLLPPGQRPYGAGKGGPKGKGSGAAH